MLEHMAEARAGLKLSATAARVIFSFMSVSFCCETDNSTILAKSTPFALFSVKNPPENRLDMLCVILKVKF